MIDTSIRKAVTVSAPIDKAFAIFTQGMDTWWPRSHKTGEGDLKQAVLETKDGGRWYEIDADGTEREWGRVLAWEPPTRLILAWQINANWQYDPALLTEVEIRFIAESADRTRVELEHRDLDRFGEAQDEIRTAFDSPNGWLGLLDAYAQAAKR
jgi:uncharacterized protein YndB with AHSA1/START domain